MKNSPTQLVKLTPPHLPTVLERPRLFTELDRFWRQHRVIWVQGPPGAGKTTLVASYLQSRKLKPLWYQLDAGDADPGSWFYYLALGIKVVAPRYRIPLPRLRPEYLPGLTVFTRRFFEQVYSRLKDPGVIVFDNYHDIPLEDPWHELMAVALENIPSSATVLVISRQLPPPSCARLEAEQRLGKFPPAALLLTHQEICVLATMRHTRNTLKPSVATLETIHEKTQGWAAGVVLLLSHHETSRELGAESDGEGTPVIFDYLASEVLQAQEESERELLLHTAWFPSFTAQMAMQLSGQNEVDKRLHALARARYFTERRGGPEPAYQYHPLFRGFLQQEATARWPITKLQVVRHQAAALLEEAGRIDDAVTMYMEAKEFKEMERLILQQAPIFFADGRAFAIERWVQGMPAGQRDGNPWLRYWEASCLLLRNPNSSVSVFEGLYEEFEQRQDEGGRWVAWCGVIDGILHAFTGYRRLDPWIEQALPHVLDKRLFPSPEIEARVTMTLFAAMLWTRLSDSRIFELENRVQEIVQVLPDYSQRIQIGFHLFQLWSWLGEMDRIEQVVLDCEDWAKHDLSPLSRALFHFVQASYAWYIGNGAQTIAGFEKGREQIRKYGFVSLKFHSQAQGIAGALITRDFDLITNLVEDLRDEGEQGFEIQGCAYSHLASLACFLRGQHEQGLTHARKLVKRLPTLTCEVVLALQRSYVAQLYIEKGQWELAEQQILRIEELAQQIPSHWFPCWSLSLKAQLGMMRGHEQEWKKSLQQWLAHCRQHRLLNPFLWLPHILARLCGQALEAGIEVEQARMVIKKLNLEPEHPRLTSDRWPWPIKVYTLGRFELMSEVGAIQFGRKVPKTPLGLLKTLIVLGGKDVSPSQVMDWLWPEADGDAAYRSLKMAVSRLRKILKQEDVIIFAGGTLSLNENVCWVDSLHFQYLIEQSEIESTQGNLSKSMKLTQRAMALYRGKLFPHDDSPWILPVRTALEKQSMVLAKYLSDGPIQSSNQNEMCDRLQNISNDNVSSV